MVINKAHGFNDQEIVVTEDDVLDLLREIFNRRYSNSSIHEYLLNCLLKLSIKYVNNAGAIRLLIEDQKKSYFCEVQQRAIEYSVLSGLSNRSLKVDVTKNVPNSKIVRETNTNK